MKRQWVGLLAIAASVVLLAWGGDAFADHVVAWGRNTYGQCDVPPGGDFVAVAAGDGHSLALKSDGSLVAWGYGDCELPKGNDFLAITTHGPYRIALKSDGSLVGWGHYKDDRCDIPEGRDFVAVAAGERSALGLRSDGSLVQWDYKGNYLRDKPPLGNDFIAIAAGDGHNLASKDDGTVVGWGRSSDGQCDAPEGVKFTAIAAGTNNSFGIKTDGSLITWGYRAKKGTAMLPRGNDFASITSYGFHSMGLRTDGSIVVWMGKRRAVSDNYFTAVAAGLDHDLALARNPQPYSNGQRPFRRRPVKRGSPVAEDIAVATSEDSEVQIKLVGHHPDACDISYYVSKRPGYGELSDNKGQPNLTYVPQANYYGLDRFTYYVRDAARRQSRYATVDIAVTPVPDEPIARNIYVSTRKGTAVEIDLVGIDYDGDALTYTIDSVPEHGKLELIDVSHNIYLYSPNPGFHPEDHFTFRANDGTTNSDAATVKIRMVPEGFRLTYNRDEEVRAVSMLEPLEVDSPVDLAVDRQGNVYILSAGTGQSAVLVCNDELEVKRRMTIEADRPRGIALGESNFYVTDTGRSRIISYTNDGTLNVSFGDKGVVGRFGTKEGEFNQPWGIAVDWEGNVYVSDAGNNRVQIFDGGGNSKSQWRQKTSYDRRFTYFPPDARNTAPRHISSFGQIRAADRAPLSHPAGFYWAPGGPCGQIFLADTGNDRVKQLKAHSGYLSAGVGGKGSERGKFDHPVDAYYDVEFDQLLVADAGNNRIQLFQMYSHAEIIKPEEMTYLQEIADQNLSNPMAVATASEEGRQIIYVADTGNNRVLKLENNIAIPVKPAPEHEVAEPTDSKFTLVTRETALVKFEAAEPIRADAIVSPDNRRVAYQHYEGRGTRRMVVNGVPGKSYDGVRDFGCVFSPDGKRFAYVATEKGRKSFVVLDGVEGTDGYTGIGNLTFSPDSQRFAYTARNSEARQGFVFVDGAKSRGYDGIRKGPIFSQDGQRLAYTVSRGGKQFVVVDGLEGMEYDSIRAGPVFGRDGKHVTYTAKRGEKGVMVREGVEIAEFDGFGYSALSPEGKRMAYISEKAGKKFVVLDGEQGKLYNKVSVKDLKFSPDGKRFVYSAWGDDGMCAVVDGEEQKFYRWVMNINFSPDSKRVAYLAGLMGEYIEQFVVVDGIEGRRYRPHGWFANLSISPPIFSPDSKHLAYVVQTKDESWVVVDEVEGRHYDEIRKETIGGVDLWHDSLVFGPDGRIGYWARRDRKWRIVVDGVESKEYWGYVQRSKLVFEGPELLHGVGFRGRELVRIELEIAEK